MYPLVEQLAAARAEVAALREWAGPLAKSEDLLAVDCGEHVGTLIEVWLQENGRSISRELDARLRDIKGALVAGPPKPGECDDSE